VAQDSVSHGKPRLMIRIIVADDSSFVRKAVRALLQSQPDFEVVGEAENGREAVQCAEALQPEVIVLDLRMPEMSGAEAAPVIWRVSPKTRIVFLSQSPATTIAALDHHTNWTHVLKSEIAQGLIAAVRSV
jgi:two-component system, NarL family, response regulator NreC